jgi:hypothetical protein
MKSQDGVLEAFIKEIESQYSKPAIFDIIHPDRLPNNLQTILSPKPFCLNKSSFRFSVRVEEESEHVVIRHLSVFSVYGNCPSIT